MRVWLAGVLAVCALCALVLWAADASPVSTALAQHRNLGKAFYENPTTQTEAVAEFRKAVDLAPNSVREKLNYGLARLRLRPTRCISALPEHRA